MKKQGSIAHQKVNNSTIMNSNDSEEDEITDKEFKKLMKE
jgi:hypothetical protein